MKFDSFGLDGRLEQAVQEMGFSTPTPIQEQTIPIAMRGTDVLGLAQTGTGKTAAFLLPILHRFAGAKPQSRSGQQRVRALVLAPTRELAEQIHEEARKLAGKTGIRSATVYGGVGKKPQIDALERGTDIIVACPGRLLDHLAEGDADLSGIEVFVLDEADRMFDMGFLPDVRRIIKRLPPKRQNLFFSATMPPKIRELADQILHNAETVQIGIIAPAETVSHAVYPIQPERKKEFFYSLLSETNANRALVFTRTKHRARSLATALDKQGYRVAALQGNMSQNARQRSITGFRRGQIDMLIATDIASRGIDVSEISHVINYDMPDTVDAYIHRIGRTGRVGRAGIAYTIAVEDDAAMVRDIEKTLGEPIERRRLSGFDYREFEPEKQFVSRASNPSGRPQNSHSGGPRRNSRNRNRRRR